MAHINSRLDENPYYKALRKQRNTWQINPTTRICQNKKAYSRQKSKLALKKGEY